MVDINLEALTKLDSRLRGNDTGWGNKRQTLLRLRNIS